MPKRKGASLKVVREFVIISSKVQKGFADIQLQDHSQKPSCPFSSAAKICGVFQIP